MTAPLPVFYRRKDAAKYLKEKYAQSIGDSFLARLACKAADRRSVRLAAMPFTNRMTSTPLR